MRHQSSTPLIATLCVSAALAFASLHNSNAAERPTIEPVWTLDLISQGYQPPVTNGHSKSGRQVAFGSDDEVVVLNDSSSCSKHNQAIAFVLDADSGRLRQKREFVSNCWPYVFGTAANGYAVMTNGGMALYSARFEKQIAIQPDVAAEHVSPDGKSIGAWKQIPGHGKTYFVSSRTLKPTGREFLDRNVIAVSETSIANVVTRLGSANQIVLIDDGVHEPRELSTECGQVQVTFLSTDTLAILGCKRLRVISLKAGEFISIAHSGISGKDWLSATSRNGERFATLQTGITPGNDGPDLIDFERISVFDVRKKQPVFTVEVKRLHGLDVPSHSSGLALSPSGKSLVVNSEGAVQMFNLP